MLKILLADDHPVVRKGLKQIISETHDMVVGDEASNAQQVLNKVLKKDYDVVLLDISMPGRNGLEILGELKTNRPNLPVLILSVHPEEQYAVRALKVGASGYLTKSSAPEELIRAIRIVSSGRKYVSNSMAERLASRLLTNSEKPLHETLSNREHTVMCMIASGKTTKEIAQELGLSMKTISTYRSRILDKMEMNSNAQIIRYAIENKLV